MSVPGKIVMRWQQARHWGMHNLKYGTPGRKAVTAAGTAGAIALSATGLLLGAAAFSRPNRKTNS